MAEPDLYLMSPPGKGWALRGRANFKSREAGAVSPARARREWLALAEAIEGLGGVVAVLPSNDELSGLPFAAEAGHVLPARPGAAKPRFLLSRMSAPHRRGESEPWAALAAELGFEVIELARGFWEGQGDVARFEDTTFLFHGGRTDREGMTEAIACFDGELLVLELREPAFHGNMALLPLPHANRLLVCPEVIAADGMDRLERRFGGARLKPVNVDEIQSYATNGLPIGDTWLAPSSVPGRVKELVKSFGMRVVELDLRELCDKAGGAARCLVCHAPGLGQNDRVPPGNRLAQFREALRHEDAG